MQYNNELMSNIIFSGNSMVDVLLDAEVDIVNAQIDYFTESMTIRAERNDHGIDRIIVQEWELGKISFFVMLRPGSILPSLASMQTKYDRSGQQYFEFYHSQLHEFADLIRVANDV